MAPVHLTHAAGYDNKTIGTWIMITGAGLFSLPLIQVGEEEIEKALYKGVEIGIPRIYKNTQIHLAGI